jgi:farnesyl-diphosphate farnesyltransferase
MRVTPCSYQKAIRDITRLMGQGMSRYAKLHAESGGKFSVDTLASFDLYCHYVAGLVGEGLSRLFSASEKESPYLGEQLTLSNSMGLMLQKTNILRDFREDVDEGRVFWPAEIWSKYVSKPEELHAPGNEDKALWALSEMTVDALAHATDALDYLSLLSNQSVFNFCAIPQVMAIATLERCFMNYDVVQRNVKIRKGEAVSVRFLPFFSCLSVPVFCNGGGRLSSVGSRLTAVVWHSQLIMASTNPRDVAYKFRDYARKIHAKARPNDPSFVKIAVLTGRVSALILFPLPSSPSHFLHEIVLEALTHLCQSRAKTKYRSSNGPRLGTLRSSRWACRCPRRARTGRSVAMRGSSSFRGRRRKCSSGGRAPSNCGNIRWARPT